MRNSQVAVIAIAILLAGLIIAGGNFVLVKSIQQNTQPRAAAVATSNRRCHHLPPDQPAPRLRASRSPSA